MGESCFSVDEPEVCSRIVVPSSCLIVSSPVQASSDTEMCAAFCILTMMFLGSQ